MDADQIAEWQSCTASSVTSAFDQGTQKSDVYEIVTQDNASKLGHPDQSTTSDTRLTLLLEDISSHIQPQFATQSHRSNATFFIHADDNAELSSNIRYLVKDFAQSTFRDPSYVATYPADIPSHLSISTELAVIVKMTLEAALLEFKQLSNIATLDSVKPWSISTVYNFEQSRIFSLEHMDLCPVGELLKLVLTNPWTETPLLDNLELSRMLFDTARYQYTDFYRGNSTNSTSSVDEDDETDVNAECEDEVHETEQEPQEQRHLVESSSDIFQADLVDPFATTTTFRCPSNGMEHRRRHKRQIPISIIFYCNAFPCISNRCVGDSLPIHTQLSIPDSVTPSSKDISYGQTTLPKGNQIICCEFFFSWVGLFEVPLHENVLGHSFKGLLIGALTWPAIVILPVALRPPNSVPYMFLCVLLPCPLRCLSQ